MELRFHGAFPPQHQDVPGTIAPKPKKEAEQQEAGENEYEPLCLLQCWTEERDGKLAYMFLMYDLQQPPYEVAKRIARYFRITPTNGGYYDFIGVTPPNAELIRPVFTRYNFKWEWVRAQWGKRGGSWVWQDSGHSVVLPYSESELSPTDEEQYTAQLSELMEEAEQQEHQATLPQPKQRFLLPTFARSKAPKEIALEEKVTTPAQV